MEDRKEVSWIYWSHPELGQQPSDQSSSDDMAQGTGGCVEDQGVAENDSTLLEKAAKGVRN